MLLAGCQAVSQLPMLGGAGDIAVTGELPPPPPRTWPDPQVDVLNQRVRSYGLVRLPAMQRYLDGLLADIKKAAGVPDWPGRVYILADYPLEAYATAAGNIYLSWTWLDSAQSEDEIVALLSHEYGHVYLHYHQLEGAVQTADTAAGVAALALGVAQRTGQAAGWTPVDTLIASYTVGRELTSAAWGRGQEASADRWGMNVSLRLGYSYEAGFKAFLERILTWEDENAQRRAALKQQLFEQVQRQAEQEVLARDQSPGTPGSQLLMQPFAKMAGALEGMVFQGKEQLGGLWDASASRHPDTVARLDDLAEQADLLPPGREGGEGRVEPWRKARSQPAVANVLGNYRLAYQALDNLQAPDALARARRSVRGATATHALPLKALYAAQQAGRGGRRDDSAVLDRNLASESDRAWMSVVERSEALQARGQRAAALRTMDAGFRYFHDAGDAWPSAIAFYGNVVGWDRAKALAKECASRFAALAQACDKAAATPAERAQADRQAEQKAKEMVDRLFK